MKEVSSEYSKELINSQQQNWCRLFNNTKGTYVLMMCNHHEQWRNKLFCIRLWEWKSLLVKMIATVTMLICAVQKRSPVNDYWIIENVMPYSNSLYIADQTCWYSGVDKSFVMGLVYWLIVLRVRPIWSLQQVSFPIWETYNPNKECKLYDKVPVFV